MKWAPVAWFENGEPCSLASDCGKFHISKAFVDGCTIYTAWHKDTAIKYSEDKIDCINACKKFS